MANKITREDLERDELAETLQGLAVWLRRNLYKLVIGVVLVVAGGGLFAGYRSYRRGISEDSSRILKIANQALVDVYNQTDEASRIAALDGAIAQLQTLIERYPDTPAAHTALYLQGNCFFQKDDLAKAQEIYKRFISASSTDEERAQGEIALAYAIENEIYFTKDVAKVEQAKEHFRRAINLAPPKSYQYYFAMMGLARVLELSYEDEEALKLYQTILAERPSPLPGGREFNPDNLANFGGDLESYAKNMADQRLSQLSLQATVKLRVERLEASMQAGHAGPNAPRRSMLPPDDPAPSSDSSADPPAASPEETPEVSAEVESDVSLPDVSVPAEPMPDTGTAEPESADEPAKATVP